jgi:hypothetical protein
MYDEIKRVLENRVPRIIFGRKRDKVTEEWRELHNEELHNLYLFSNIIRQIKSKRMIWAVHVALMGEGTKVLKVLVGKPEGKRPLRKSSRWGNKIRMDLREIGWGRSGLNWCRIGTGGSCCECRDETSGSIAREVVFVVYCSPSITRLII